MPVTAVWSWQEQDWSSCRCVCCWCILSCCYEGLVLVANARLLDAAESSFVCSFNQHVLHFMTLRDNTCTDVGAPRVAAHSNPLLRVACRLWQALWVPLTRPMVGLWALQYVCNTAVAALHYVASYAHVHMPPE